MGGGGVAAGRNKSCPYCVSTVSNYCSRAGATTREGRGPYQRMHERMQSHDPLFVNQWLLCSVGLVVLLCLLIDVLG